MPVSLVSDNLGGRQPTYGTLTSPFCYQDGCKRLRARRKGGRFNGRYCTMHADRRYKFGVPWASVRKRGPVGEGCVSRGYRIVQINGRRAYEHQIVWENANGPIPKGCVIHHINNNKLDNRIENLLCLTRSDHRNVHMKGSIECL